MSGAGDSTTGMHVSSWGWIDADIAADIPRHRKWHVTRDDRSIGFICLPDTYEAGDVLCFATAMVEVMVSMGSLPAR